MLQRLLGGFRPGARAVPWLLLGAATLAPVGALAGRYAWAESHARAARQAAGRRAFGDALAHWDEYLKIRPDNPAAQLEAARAARRAGRFPQAEHHLRECRFLAPGKRGVELEEALLDAQRGQWTPAEEAALWARAGHDDANAPLILEAMTQGYLYSYRVGNALDCLDQWLRREPDNAQALYWRGWAWESRQDFPRAGEDYRRAAELDPEHTDARLRLAEALLASGQGLEAADEFERARGRRPGDAAALLGLARCRRQLGQLDEARHLLDLLVAEHGRDPAVLRERGRVALADGQPAEAERWLRRAVDADPADAESCYALSQSLRQQGQDEEARRVLGRAERIEADLEQLHALNDQVARNPGDPEPRCRAGLLCLRNGQAEEGLRWLNGALQLDPRHATSHRALADYYDKAGRPELAAPHRRFLSADPGGN